MNYLTSEWIVIYSGTYYLSQSHNLLGGVSPTRDGLWGLLPLPLPYTLTPLSSNLKVLGSFHSSVMQCYANKVFYRHTGGASSGSRGVTGSSGTVGHMDGRPYFLNQDFNGCIITSNKKESRYTEHHTHFQKIQSDILCIFRNYGMNTGF